MSNKENFKEALLKLFDLVTAGDIDVAISSSDDEGIVVTKDVGFYVGEDFIQVNKCEKHKKTVIIPFDKIISVKTLDYEYAREMFKKQKEEKEELFNSLKEAIENDKLNISKICIPDMEE